MTSAERDELRQKNYNATVVWLKKIHAELMVVRVRPDHSVPHHQPGQYTTLGMGQWEPRVSDCQEEEPKSGDERKMIRRAYSLSCSVLDEHGKLLELNPCPWLEFYIVLVRQSEKGSPALTPRLFTLQQGDRLYLGEKIAGRFTLDPVQPTDNVIFLSTGTGEAPHNYMLWELLRRGHQGRILAACCVRYFQDLGYRTLHEELMRRNPRYVYLPLTTREAEFIHQKMYIQDLITSGRLEERLGCPLDPDHTHVYLCGNPRMIGVPLHDRTTGKILFPHPPGVVEILSQRQFQCDQPGLKLVGNVHFEEYW